MSRIHSNIPALRAFHRLGRNQRDLETRLERLSTGLRINRGQDDPAGLIASERLRSEIRGIQQAIENSARASNVVNTAEGALNEVSALLLDLQSLVVAAANHGGLTDEEVRANQLQIDSILASIDRIAETATFAGKKLLDGSQDYILSMIPTAAFASISVFAAYVPQGGGRDVVVKVIQSAQTARVALLGANSAGPSTMSATTVEIRGTLGSHLFSFASGTTMAEIRMAVNDATVLTGVSAFVSAPSVGGLASALVLTSTTFGSDAFVSVEPVSGGFVTFGNAGTVIRDEGVDAGVLIDGQRAAVRGFRADVRSNFLDARIELDSAFAQTLSAATFRITGGGSLFQITPLVTPNGQAHLGFRSVRTTQLGDRTSGMLYTLRSGYANDLASGNFSLAQSIINEAISQISIYRGRLGNVQRNVIDPAINSQNIALENITASESVIRDADMAEEVSALTRAQVLVQSTQTMLRIANSAPTSVLSLLG